MEYLSGGDFMRHIEKAAKFDIDLSRFYAAEIVCGLQFLHNMGMIHR